MVSLSWSTIEFIAITTGIILIILFTVGGNLVVLFAFYSDPHLLTPSNHFLLSMAIADLLVGLIAIPFYSYAEMQKYWPFGELFCKIWLTIDDVATMASVLSIVAITIERYWSINHSVHYRRYTTKARIRIFSIFIWLIPLLNFAPGIWFLNPQEQSSANNQTQNNNNNNTECIGAYHSHTVYLIVAQINFFAWPLFVIIVLNALIVFNLYRRSQRFPSMVSFNDLRKNNNDNIRESKEKKIEEIQIDINQNEENIDTLVRQRASSLLDKSPSQCNIDMQTGTVPATINEVDEAKVNVDTNQLVLSLDTETNLKNSSSSTIYKRFKHVISDSSVLTSKSKPNSQRSSTCGEKSPQGRSSLFGWRNSSVLLMVSGNVTLNATGEHRNVRRLRRDKRAATSLLTLVLVFMIFLLPYVFVVVVGRIFSWEILTDTNGQVYAASFWLLWLNSTINPILYPFIQPKFRDAYRKIFLRLVQRRERILSFIGDMRTDK